MPPFNLEDIEAYLLKRAREQPTRPTREGLSHWLRDRFSELRAREYVKKGW